MTIAQMQFQQVGPKIYTVDGPLGSGSDRPAAAFAPGTRMRGPNGAEFEYVLFQAPSVPVTVNQGDVYSWDNSFNAVPIATAASPRGSYVGTLFVGGAIGTASPQPFSQVLTQAGTYAMWMQRSGASLCNAASTAANGNLAETTATAGRLNAPASPTATSKLVTGLYFPLAANAFTATTVSGSTGLSAVSSGQGLQVGQTLSGTGIATGTYIKAINGSGITMSVPATASGTGVTVTATNYSTYVTTTNNSAVLTNVTTAYGIYPGQTIAGTGIPGSTTIVSVDGGPGAYTITMSANATATANNINATVNGYIEAELHWPYVDKTN